MWKVGASGRTNGGWGNRKSKRTYRIHEILVIGLLDERDDAARGGGRAAVVLAIREVIGSEECQILFNHGQGEEKRGWE